MAARVALAFALLCTALAAPARAQEYQRLHVRSFTLSSDAARPRLEQPFRVWLSIRVSENLSELRNVFLPTFIGAEELGDERQISHGASGTTYRETLTLVAHTRGTLSIGSAYLDAIDARDGKAKRFISNPLRLEVGDGPIAQGWNVLRTIAFALLDVLLAGTAILAAALMLSHRRAVLRTSTPDRAAANDLPPQVTADGSRSDLEVALDHLRARRDRAAVLSVRAVFWRAAGASPGETLGDVLRRPAAADAQTRRMLMILERAAFIEQAHLDHAIDDVLSERGAAPA